MYLLTYTFFNCLSSKNTKSKNFQTSKSKKTSNPTVLLRKKRKSLLFMTEKQSIEEKSFSMLFRYFWKFLLSEILIKLSQKTIFQITLSNKKKQL